MDERKLYMSQPHYIESLFTQYDMQNCHAVSFTLSYDLKHTPAKDIDYPAMVGALLLYIATITPPVGRKMEHGVGVT